LAPSFTNQLKQFVALVARSGVTDGARIVLRELGLRTAESFTYPGLERRFVVGFDPVWRWIGKGIREPGVLRFAKDRIRSGSTVLDVGAHVGEWTLLFSELVGESGRVISFEPDPVARASLEKNLEMNGISNVQVEEKGVSDKAGKALLAAERFGSGLSSIVPPQGRGTHHKAVEVATITLDQYCETHGISPDWIKIDAEGAEPLILRGMQHLIKTARPSVILEFHSDALTDDEKNEAWSVVTERASSVEFLQSRRKDHVYLEKLSKGYTPDCGFLVVHVKY
jgi:FkbM family methyltransferase